MFLPALDTGIGAVLPVFLLLALGAPLLLWWFIETERNHEEEEHRDWESAERAARRDTRDDRR
ncbi:hypothetical protein [Haladaptatus sp. DYF46]|uniref:hypothetical protein n=1 Tax=Haladaptatus sp. DYF46 TaxID=2886041 RepID=UPI001E575FC2|nr:hypothetical protein [Haladaptatus sp. DYF46]